MKRHSVTSNARAGVEHLARQQRVKPIRTRQDLYRHSVHDDENLDDWLKYVQSLRRDNATDRAPEP